MFRHVLSIILLIGGTIVMSANSLNNESEKVMCDKLPMQKDGIVRLSIAPHGKESEIE